MARRTLVVHSGGVGDFLFACPALGHLARTRLELAVAGGLAYAAHGLDDIDFTSVFVAPSARLRAFLEPFDRAVVWMRDTGKIEAGLRACGVGDVRCFPGLPPEDWTQHASEYYLHCMGAPPTPPFRLELPPDAPPLDVVIHPGSGGRRKNWPLERFLAVAEMLEEQGRDVTWCIGPAEEALALPANVCVLRCVSLVELGRALAGAAFYLGNDSGITHLAAAVGCPTLAVFTTTDPAVWAPRGEHVWVVRTKAEVTVSAMARRLRGKVGRMGSMVRKSEG